MSINCVPGIIAGAKITKMSKRVKFSACIKLIKKEAKNQTTINVRENVTG